MLDRGNVAPGQLCLVDISSESARHYFFSVCRTGVQSTGVGPCWTVGIWPLASCVWLTSVLNLPDLMSVRFVGLVCSRFGWTPQHDLLIS